jgi:hypothetical protein
MKISVVIVHWNTPDALEKQLALIKSSKDLEVVVVDNASKKSIKNLKLIHKNLRVVENNANLGFATACNQGAIIAKGEWLLFLNPDTFITSDKILKLVKSAEIQNLDAASPTQTGENYYKPLPTWLSLTVEFSPLGRIIPLSIFKNRTLFGGCLLIKASVLKRLGGWDNKFFLWFEDSDLTKRLYDMKYRIGWIPIKYKHLGGGSFAQLDFKYKKIIFFKSMNIYAKKHFSLMDRFIVMLLTAINIRR